MTHFFSLFTMTAEATDKPYQLLLPIALILFLSKILGIFCRKIKLPQVIGLLAAGLLLGLITLIPNQSIFTTYTREGLDFLGKIGVILIMFSAGVETDIQKIKATGVASLIITFLGVIVPMGFGIGVAYLFFPSNSVFSNLFYGVILSATSVSITVATLKELGKLDSKIGSSIISAAILDDIIGVILLSLVISLKGNPEGGESSTNIWIVMGLMLAFFVIAFVLGIFVKKMFSWLDKRYPHHRRIPIFGFALCFFYAYAAEKWFGVADITGAYIAGMIISQTKSKAYIDRRTEIETYILFGPIFFANIGLMMYDGFSFNDSRFIWFGIVYVLVGILGKIIGAGCGAKICRYSWNESLQVGVGMMARAEVVVVCTQKGIDSGLVQAELMPFILILILCTSLLTPLCLKLLNGKKENGETPEKEPIKEENSSQS